MAPRRALPATCYRERIYLLQLNVQPQRPNLDTVRSYIARFDANERYRTGDEGLSKLLSAFSRNDNLDEILLKVTAVNKLYSTNILGVFEVAKRILELKIDRWLEVDSADVVDQIAEVRIKDKTRRFYSFATKYCCWHRPEGYPMHDRFVNQSLWEYKKADSFANFDRCELSGKYARFREIVSGFRDHYQLAQFSFKQLDKFLWSYGQELSENARRRRERET